MGRCSICHTVIHENEDTTSCSTCQAVYHSMCWTELGGCATYGCKEAAAAEQLPVRQNLIGWGDVKECPSCGRGLHPQDLDCRCGAEFPHSDPITPSEYREWWRVRERVRVRRKAILALSAVSLLGVPAPICGPIAGLIAWHSREEMAGREGTCLAIGYGAAALGALYCVLILILVGGG